MSGVRAGTDFFLGKWLFWRADSLHHKGDKAGDVCVAFSYHALKFDIFIMCDGNIATKLHCAVVPKCNLQNWVLNVRKSVMFAIII